MDKNCNYVVIFINRDPLAELSHHGAESIMLCPEQKVTRLPQGMRYEIHPLSDFEDRYWWASARGIAFHDWPFTERPRYSSLSAKENYSFAASTKEVQFLLSQGHSVALVAGPYDSRVRADNCIDMSWQAPDFE
jgi:hypothetical protein